LPPFNVIPPQGGTYAGFREDKRGVERCEVPRLSFRFDHQQADRGRLTVEINPFEPGTLVLIALLNPVAIVVAFLMGRRADQWQKIIVAAFAASLCGFALYWIVAAVGLMPIHALGGEAGIVLMQFVFGLAWAALGYWTRR
jgi:hypothetical protein